MLEIFITLIVLIVLYHILMKAYIFFKYEIPIRRFLDRTQIVEELYETMMKEVLKVDVSYPIPIQIVYDDVQLVFSNTAEASVEFEKVIKEALELHEKLVQLANLSDELMEEKEILIDICHQVRMLRWQMQTN